VNVLPVTPRQAFEVARLLDRTGEGIVYGDSGIVTVLVDVYGVGEPTLALELDADGEVIARQALTLRRPDADPCDDFDDEEPLPPPVDIEDARPALRCTRPSPRADDGICARCRHLLPDRAGEPPKRLCNT
jgi:hypothetical protein